MLRVASCRSSSFSRLRVHAAAAPAAASLATVRTCQTATAAAVAAQEPEAPRLLPLLHSSPDDPELTIYVKGFLAPGEHPDHYQPWVLAHRSVCDKYDWGLRCDGYEWQSGSLWGVGAIPAPVAVAASVAWQLFVRGRRVSQLFGPSTLAIATAQELAVLAGRILWQYRTAHASLPTSARAFADRLSELSTHYPRIRLVAHSLGCAVSVHAVALLPEHLRPIELHLCAPAFQESSVRDLLASGLAREQTVVYYNRNDFVLGAMFRLLHGVRESAVGEVGLESPLEYPRTRSIDVQQYFESWWVHREYPAYLPDYIAPPVSAPAAARHDRKLPALPPSQPQPQAISISHP